jgi:3-oxoadipate enol-lactonase
MKLELRGIQVFYKSSGAGLPCVLVHGLAEDHSSWANVQANLSGVESFAYDLRGHGKTTLGHPENSLKQLGLDLIAFLERVTGPAICVGFSLGGVIVLWAAAARPDLMKKAIVIGTSSKVGRAAVGFFQERIEMLATDHGAFGAALRNDTAAQLARKPDDLDAITAQRLDAVGEGGGYVNAAAAMIKMAAEPLTPMLSGIRIPVAVIGGEKDVFCPRKAADIICNEIPDASFQQIPDAGHLMSVDQPELYAAAIQKAISER